MSKATRQKQRIWLIIAFLVVGYGASKYAPEPTQISPTKVQHTQIQTLFQQQRSDVQLQVQATVTKLLADDINGSQHQRFIVTLSDGHTLLISHNIDIAPRINNLQVGDHIMVYGEYEWNTKGGVIHWTHHDPDNKHPDGWIKHKGSLYQ